MDIASLGAAASQIANGQRQQQAALSGLRSSQLQAQTFVSLIQQAVSSKPVTAPESVQAPAQVTSNSTPNSTPDQSQSGRPLPRGSIVNILA